MELEKSIAFFFLRGMDPPRTSRGLRNGRTMDCLRMVFGFDNAGARIQIVSVRIIAEAFLVETGRKYPQAARHLDARRKVVRMAAWRNLVEVRRTYPDADMVRVGTGRQTLVFNIRRNDYRLIVAVHFNRQIVYTLRFMTHAEYSKDRWKETL